MKPKNQKKILEKQNRQQAKKKPSAPCPQSRKYYSSEKYLVAPTKNICIDLLLYKSLKVYLANETKKKSWKLHGKNKILCIAISATVCVAHEFICVNFVMQLTQCVIKCR